MENRFLRPSDASKRFGKRGEPGGSGSGAAHEITRGRLVICPTAAHRRLERGLSVALKKLCKDAGLSHIPAT